MHNCLIRCLVTLSLSGCATSMPPGVLQELQPIPLSAMQPCHSIPPLTSGSHQATEQWVTERGADYQDCSARHQALIDQVQTREQALGIVPKKK
jgi:hypothetical protein